MTKKRKPRTLKTVKKPGMLEDKILQNLVELQRVHTGLASKFESLSDQISNLLALFEMTARNIAQQPAMRGVEKDKEFLEKIDMLLEQNKTIARGLTLMEQKIREKVYGPAMQREFQPRPSK